MLSGSRIFMRNHLATRELERMSLVAALLAAIGYGAGSVLQSVGTQGRRTARALARSPYYLAGLAVDGVCWVLTLVALRSLPVYVVQAVLASALAFTVLLSRVWLKATMRGRDVAAIGALTAALAIVGVAGREQPAPALTGLVTLLLTAGGVLVCALTGVALAVPRRVSATTLAVLAGLAFSGTALAARAMQVRSPLWHTLLAPLPWVVVATGVAGTVAYAAALERGAVGPVTALLWAVEVVVPAVVSIPLLGDGVRPGWTIPLAAALLVVTAASVVLAGAPAPATFAGQPAAT
jgi:drug/metabolite transporter (DMT)-like permease